MKNMKEMRMKSLLSQEEFAKKLNVTQSTVSKWEKGSTEPSMNMLREIAAVLGCNIQDLFD